jgi:transglutaminase-like putative cysteine protease
MPGREATRKAHTPIRGGPTLHAKCCASFLKVRHGIRCIRGSSILCTFGRRVLPGLEHSSPLLHRLSRPVDFAAWFEVYLGGQWYTFDARNNVPRIGRVLLARGRDAADVAITTTFGPNKLASFRVWTDEILDGQA